MQKVTPHQNQRKVRFLPLRKCLNHLMNLRQGFLYTMLSLYNCGAIFDLDVYLCNYALTLLHLNVIISQFRTLLEYVQKALYLICY